MNCALSRAADRPLPQNTFCLSTFLLANSLQPPSKRQFVAIRIEHVEVAFAPGRVLWDFRIESSLFQMCPERIHIRNVEDQPSPRDTVSPCSRFRIADSESFARSEEKLACSPP
jgi:hypothetical protein